ncbi:MAG: ribosome small subunit-dependent GTPase A [Oscillospiraceae bacterium]|nr:ribosome small subunit-dependent GTPase A [Oscillospiraceae bacterium]
MRGRIVKGVGNFFDVYIEEDCELKDKIIACNSKGIFRKDNIKPLVGDMVDIELNFGNKDETIGIINTIAERKNFLFRPPIANLDILFIVAAVKSPDPAYYFIDKLTVTAVDNDITPVIIINKIDLLDNSELYDIYKKAGFKTFKISAETMTPDRRELSEIKEEMRGRICAFSGVSGVGKSSVLNKIFPELKLDTGSLSNKIERGKHTTRVVELFKNGLDGYVADTPGFSMIDFENYVNISKDNLILDFPDLNQYATGCRYKKCAHIKEEGCEVLHAVEENKVAKERHESYTVLYDALKKQKNKDWK